MKRIMFLAAIAIVALSSTLAAQSAETKAEVARVPSKEVLDAVKAAPAELFRAKEWQFDLLYQARTEDLDSFTHGGGLGLTYFFTRNLGFGFEAKTEKPESAVFDRLGLATVFRVPIESLRLAPEVRAGFDYDLEDSWEKGESKRRTGFDAFVGAGAEYRITQSIGVGVEARAVFPIDEPDRNCWLGLVKLRLNF